METSKLKIGVYAICKNEAHFVKQWMESMREADLVVVLDTGSTDDTVSLLQEEGAIVHQTAIVPWRFDVARNLSLSHVPDDVDICVCTDLDERFVPGWRSALEKAWSQHQSNFSRPVAKAGRYIYNWSLKADGTPDIQFTYFKVHERKDFIWKCPVHEYVHYIGTKPLEHIFIPGMVLNHYPDPGKSRGSYLPLLELGVAEDKEDDRMHYYLGREYFYQKEWRKCIAVLQDYLALPKANWKEERCAAMRWIAKAYHHLNHAKEAYSWYYKAIAELPTMRDVYVEFANTAYDLRDWVMCAWLVEEALLIPSKSPTYVNMGYAWDHTLYDLGAIAWYRLGRYETALQYAMEAWKRNPNEIRLEKNVRLIEQAYQTKHKV